MPNKPTSDLSWATGASSLQDIKEPPAPQKATGWITGQAPPRNWWNWLLHHTGLWLKYLRLGPLTFIVDEMVTDQSPTANTWVLEYEIGTSTGAKRRLYKGIGTADGLCIETLNARWDKTEGKWMKDLSGGIALCKRQSMAAGADGGHRWQRRSADADTPWLDAAWGTAFTLNNLDQGLFADLLSAPEVQGGTITADTLLKSDGDGEVTGNLTVGGDLTVTGAIQAAAAVTIKRVFPGAAWMPVSNCSHPFALVSDNGIPGDGLYVGRFAGGGYDDAAAFLPLTGLPIGAVVKKVRLWANSDDAANLCHVRRTSNANQFPDTGDGAGLRCEKAEDVTTPISLGSAGAWRAHTVYDDGTGFAIEHDREYHLAGFVDGVHELHLGLVQIEFTMTKPLT